MNALPEFQPNPDLLRLLREIENGVMTGDIVALGVVYGTATGINARTVGPPLPLYLGADMMKNSLMSQVMGPPSRLVRPMV